MVNGTYVLSSLNIPLDLSGLKEHEKRILLILDDIINHGFGEITITVTETKNFKTKILILAGRSWAYFIDKQLKNFESHNIL